MKGKIKVSERGTGYFSDELRDSGFVGDVEFSGNAATATLIKPGTSLDVVERSLRIVLQDVELRKIMREKKDGCG